MPKVVYPDWLAADLARERETIQQELVALGLRARRAGLTSVGLVIDLLIAQCMDGEWPCEADGAK